MAETVEEAKKKHSGRSAENSNGGYNWARTSDLHDVNVTL